jgi:hypothetical protein
MMVKQRVVVHPFAVCSLPFESVDEGHRAAFGIGYPEFSGALPLNTEYGTHEDRVYAGENFFVGRKTQAVLPGDG